MHNFFYIPELVLEVADYLDVHDKLHLCLTCKELWSAAGASIWHEIVDAPALCRLLPVDLQLEVLDNIARMVHFNVSPFLTRKDWEPLLKYSRHIRSLCFADEDNTDQTRAALLLLASHSEPNALFPQLQSVSLHLSSDDSLVVCPRFLRFPFSTLLISISARQTNMPRLSSVILLLQAVERWCQTLEEFSLMIERSIWISEGGIEGWTPTQWEAEWRGRLEPSAATMISQLSRLKVVKLRILSEGHLVLPSLAALAHLEVLEIDIVLFTQPRPFVLPSGAFRSLKELIIPSDIGDPASPPNGPLPLVHLEGLLEAISSATFSKLDVFAVSGEFAAVKSVLQVIANKWASSFECLKLRLGIWGAADGVDIPLATFLPLTRCRGMQVFELDCHSPLNLSDDHFDFLSLAWPHLTRLRVGEAWYGHIVPGVHAVSLNWTPLTTPRSLEYFADRCPKLRFLSIPVNFDVPCAPRDSAPAVSQLRTIAIPLTSKCSSPESAIQFLVATFPQIQTARTEFLLRFMNLGIHEDYDDEDDEEWDGASDSEEEDTDRTSETSSSAWVTEDDLEDVD